MIIPQRAAILLPLILLAFAAARLCVERRDFSRKTLAAIDAVFPPLMALTVAVVAVVIGGGE